MQNKKNDFPNGLRIVRRRVVQDDTMKFIENLLKRIDGLKNQKSEYLTKYLEQSKKINIE